MFAVEIRRIAANKRTHIKQEEKLDETWRAPNITGSSVNKKIRRFYEKHYKISYHPCNFVFVNP